MIDLPLIKFRNTLHSIDFRISGWVNELRRLLWASSLKMMSPSFSRFKVWWSFRISFPKWATIFFHAGLPGSTTVWCNVCKRLVIMFNGSNYLLELWGRHLGQCIPILLSILTQYSSHLQFRQSRRLNTRLHYLKTINKWTIFSFNFFIFLRLFK